MISDVFQSFNGARDEAETAANNVVRDFEKATIGDTNIVISDLVKSIFKSFNQVVDTAQDLSKQVVSKATNLNTNIDISKETYKRESPIDTLKNQSSELGLSLSFYIVYNNSFIVKIEFKNKLTELET